VRPSLEPFAQVLEMTLQIPLVLLPRRAVDSRGRLPLEAVEGFPECVHVRDVVEECGEPLRPVPLCRLPYPLPRTVHALPALRPERDLRDRVPLGWAPSPPRLRPRFPGFVRRLRWYNGPI